MNIYLDLVILINFLVDIMLLLGANRMLGFPLRLGRTALAAAIGGVYSGVCLLHGFSFLGNTAWRVLFLLLMSAVAYGCDRSAWSRMLLFAFLSMALGGLVMLTGRKDALALLLTALSLSLLSFVGFRKGLGGQSLACVELFHHGKSTRFVALRDSGNVLTDPVTGQSVLVVAPEIAWKTLSLTQEQLEKPVETMQSLAVPGLRLIPYRAVGTSGGVMLGMRFDRVVVGGTDLNVIVAFSPNGFGSRVGYQALTRGN